MKMVLASVTDSRSLSSSIDCFFPVVFWLARAKANKKVVKKAANFIAFCAKVTLVMLEIWMNRAWFEILQKHGLSTMVRFCLVLGPSTKWFILHSVL